MPHARTIFFCTWLIIFRRSGPSINHEAEPRRYARASSFKGSPNLGTDEVIADIREVTRNYLNDRGSPAMSPTKRAAERNRARLAAAEQRLLGADGSALAPWGSQTMMEASSMSLRTGSVAGGGASFDANGAAGGSEAGAGAPSDNTDNTSEVPLDTNVQLQLIFQYYCKFGRTGPLGDDQDTIGACCARLP